LSESEKKKGQQPMKVAVTGATGRVGANLVRRLVEAGHAVRSLVRPASPRREKLKAWDTEVVQVHLGDLEAVGAALAGCEAVFHLAADMRADNAGQFQGNTVPTFNLLEAVVQRGLELQRFVFASSDVLYPHSGYCPETILEDEVIQRPGFLYGAAKAMGEVLCEAYRAQHGLPTVIVRFPFMFCGKELLEPYMGGNSFRLDLQLELARGNTSPAGQALTAELQRLSDEGKRLVIPLCPEGPAWKKHVGDVRDIASGLLCVLENENAVGQTLNLMGQPLHFDVAVKHLAELTGWDYAEVPFGRAMFYEYNLARTRELIGFYPEHDSRSMVEAAWRHSQGEDIGVVAV